MLNLSQIVNGEVWNLNKRAKKILILTHNFIIVIKKKLNFYYKLKIKDKKI